MFRTALKDVWGTVYTNSVLRQNNLNFSFGVIFLFIVEYFLFLPFHSCVLKYWTMLKDVWGTVGMNYVTRKNNFNFSIWYFVISKCNICFHFLLFLTLMLIYRTALKDIWGTVNMNNVLRQNNLNFSFGVILLFNVEYFLFYAL